MSPFSGLYTKGSVLLALFLSCFMLPFPTLAEEVKHVSVSVSSSGEAIPPSVARRIESSISSIGLQVLLGKDDSLFKLNEWQYNKVLADIINRVVVGYVVSGLNVSYGSDTSISVVLQPVGKMIRTVETEIDYGNLSPAAKAYISKDTEDIPRLMAELLTGLPVDSVGWAESVSQSAGKTLIGNILPEFQATIEVDSGVHTKVRVYLIPKGDIVRTGKITFGKTTVPRILMLRAAMEMGRHMRALEGLPVAFVLRHKEDLERQMREILMADAFIKRYEIEIHTRLIPGEETELLADALTDHWVIQAEAWLDTGRDGNQNTAIRGKLGHFAGQNDLIFGEARVYPGPMKWNIYGGWEHKFGGGITLGYKYDFSDQANHVFGRAPFGKRFALRYDRDFQARENEFGLSYRIHNYMTVEYVYNDEEGKWLRLIANL